MGSSRDTIVSGCASFLRERGFEARRQQPLEVPYFRGELNRCIEHDELNSILRGGLKAGALRRWFVLTPVCRLNDLRRSQYATHSTLFEVLAFINTGSSDEGSSARADLVHLTCELLTNTIGLDIERLGVTYFSGGEVVPGVVLRGEEEWRREWIRAGVRPENLFGVEGMKNYVLFVGPNERCGPKCEIMYRIDHPNGNSWLELGTIILDCGVFSRGECGWSIEVPATIIGGGAFGIERLEMAQLQSPKTSSTQILGDLLAICERYMRQNPSAHSLFAGDMLTLGDQVRTALFLLAEPGAGGSRTIEQVLEIIFNRIRRKLAILEIKPWQECIASMVDCLCAHYSVDFPGLVEHRFDLVERLNQVDWPRSWNPESYDPT